MHTSLNSDYPVTNLALANSKQSHRACYCNDGPIVVSPSFFFAPSDLDLEPEVTRIGTAGSSLVYSLLPPPLLVHLNAS